MFVLLFGLIIIGFALKESMNNYLSKMMKAQAGSEIIHSGSAYFDSTFNDNENGKSYQVTFLEFGANCPACKRMESVIQEIRTKYPQKVNVVFLNALKPEKVPIATFQTISSPHFITFTFSRLPIFTSSPATFLQSVYRQTLYTESSHTMSGCVSLDVYDSQLFPLQDD